MGNFKKLLIITILVGLISCKATQKAPVKTTYDVVLTDITNSSKLIVMKYVFDLNKLNIEDAKKTINAIPVTIKSGISIEEATKIKQELEALKAVVEIK